MGCRLTKDESNTTTATTTTATAISTMYNHTTANDLPLCPSIRSSTPSGSVPAADKIDYKSRLERKMCLAKETPELNFDLSNCNLKNVPSGVFVLCRVLRKELLDLNNNKLTMLNGSGGILNDLYLIKTLNLQYNKIKQLPDEIYKLENLRELFISNNLLIKLPKTINVLKYLELIDISYNNIQTIDEINFMPCLKILNLSGNKNLRKLPETLGTCDNLCDLIVDNLNLEWPPIDVINGGTLNIIKFLTTGEQELTAINNVTTDQFKIEIGKEAITMNNENINTNILLDNDSQVEASRLKLNLSSDNGGGAFTLNQRSTTGCESTNKDIGECENNLIKEIQIRQQKHKEQLLKAVLNQQQETESLVNQIQQRKDSEKTKLIKDVLEAEISANQIIEQLLALKNSFDHSLLEKERIEEERMLEKVHVEHSELRKQEILSKMLDGLRDEECKIQNYQNRKLTSSHDILEKEIEASIQLQQFLEQCEKNRTDIIQKICENEELQKQAVINLIAKNDARSWGLVEQLKIVEAQLANMTLLEIQKRKISTNEQMNELAEKRICLIKLLTDLLEQQETRKKQLFNTILTLEAQKSSEQQDFWLLQYQRLLDSRPLEFSMKTNTIDPLLGYNFLVNGVIHCLPFLQKLWNNSNVQLDNLTMDDLKMAGIRTEKDRKLILKSIQEFLRDVPNYNSNINAKFINDNQHHHHHQNQQQYNHNPTAPPISPTQQERQISNLGAKIANVDLNTASATVSAGPERNHEFTLINNTQNMPECVICMDEGVKIIFLPCGHMCCCLNCQVKVEICPICRADIERKVKIVQP